MSNAQPVRSKSLNVKKNESADLLPLVTPGEILKEEFLQPFELTEDALALALHAPATRVREIVKGKRPITAETALRLARYFGTTPEFWMNLQSHYDLNKAKREKLQQINREVKRRRQRNQAIRS